MSWPEKSFRARDAGYRAFGEPVTYTPPGGSPEALTGIFDREPIVVEDLGDVGMLSSELRVQLRTDEFTGPLPVRYTDQKPSAMVVRGVTYRVQEVSKPTELNEISVRLHRSRDG